MPKISIIGAGNVGAHVAVSVAGRELGDTVLIDVNGEMAEGKGKDMTQAMAMANVDTLIAGTHDCEKTAGSDVVIITAGQARKPGMSRDDLLHINAEIVGKTAAQAVSCSPDCILIVVTNPVNTMAQLAWQVSGLPKSRVIGVAGVLDTARFKAFIAEELGVGASRVQAMVVGDHGDLMVPLVEHCRVDGKHVTDLLSRDRIDTIVDRVRHGGSEIVNLLKDGSAYYAPATATVELVECVLKNQMKMMPCAVLLEGEYGVNGLYVGVPALIARNGVEQVVEIHMSEEESAAFHVSVEAIRKRNAVLDE